MNDEEYIEKINNDLKAISANDPLVERLNKVDVTIEELISKLTDPRALPDRPEWGKGTSKEDRLKMASQMELTASNIETIIQPNFWILDPSFDPEIEALEAQLEPTVQTLGQLACRLRKHADIPNLTGRPTANYSNAARALKKLFLERTGKPHFSLTSDILLAIGYGIITEEALKKR